MKTPPPNHRDKRVRRPERLQVEMQFYSLDQMLASDHQARVVWAYVQSLDLSMLYERIQVTSSDAGRPAIAPEILVALWLLATLESIGAARELERRCQRDIPYMWICGGVSVNHHTLSDFRSENGDFLESVLVDSIASLMHQGLVTLETVAQDGMRVRAHAGRGSFRREPTLRELQREAAQHVERLKRENESESERQKSDARREAAAERAARERQERLEEALRQHEELARQREKRNKGDGKTTRISTTDPDARRMKMANGGYDPAYNVQFSSDAKVRLIVGVDVTNEGTDGGQMAPMVESLETNYGKRPAEVMVDSAFTTKEAVTEVETQGSKVVGGIPRAGQLEKNGKDPHSPQRGDTPEYEAFRARMSEKSYQELFRKRPSVAEFPNAVCRNHGLNRFNVRGLVKVKAVALWHALAFNFQRMRTMGILS